MSPFASRQNLLSPMTNQTSSGGLSTSTRRRNVHKLPSSQIKADPPYLPTKSSHAHLPLTRQSKMNLD